MVQSIYRITAICFLFALFATLVTPVMLMHLDCNHMAATSCPHCHPPATAIRDIPLCCASAQSTPPALTTAITLEAHTSSSIHLLVHIITKPSNRTICASTAAPSPPPSHLILRI